MGVGFNDLHPQQPPSLIFFNACMVLERTTCAADVPSQSQRNKLQELGGVVSCVVTAPSALLCLFLLFCFALLRFYSHHHPALRTSPPASGNLIHQKDGIQRCTCTHPRITDLPTSYLHCCSTAARRRKSMPLHKARERQRASHPGPDRRRRTHHNHLVRLPAAGTPNTRSSTPPSPRTCRAWMTHHVTSPRGRPWPCAAGRRPKKERTFPRPWAGRGSHALSQAKKKTAAAAGDWCMLHSARTHRGRGGRKEEGGTAEKRKRPLHGVSRSRGRSNSMHSDGVWCGVIPAGRGASRAPTTPQNAVDDVLPIFLWIKQIIYK
jgi:hypothetical protein